MRGKITLKKNNLNQKLSNKMKTNMSKEFNKFKENRELNLISSNYSIKKGIKIAKQI